MKGNFSNKKELNDIREYIKGYFKLPISNDVMPGNVLEGIIASSKNAIVLNTYDFIDVIDENKKIGWQVKSTKENSPLTWKRVKLENSTNLIKESFESDNCSQNLGNQIINFCNENAKRSLLKYDLNEIIFSRLIVCNNKRILYFEKQICTLENPDVFNKEDFIWFWSKKITKKDASKKERLQSLQGFHKISGKKWFSWYGMGENQLHFSGEKFWWPKDKNYILNFKLENQKHKMDFLKKI